MSISNLYPTISPSLLLDFANVKALDPRVTFARASSGVCYDGVTTAKAEENLLTYSQEFDEWSASNVTVTANATTAPDGTTTADLMYPSSTGSYRFIRQTLNSGNVQSIFAKASGFNWLAMTRATSTATPIWFDLQNGVVGTVGVSSGAVSTDIIDYGNGWYRCVVVFDSDDNDTRFMVTDADNDTNATANGTDGIFIWGAQLEQRDAVTAYTPTTTQPITNYIPVLQTASANVPRFDHDPVTGESLGLLVEEQRTNLIPKSQVIGYPYSPVRMSATNNAVVAPDGTVSADILKTVNISGSRYLYHYLLPLTEGTYTLSFYAKAAPGLGSCIIQIHRSSNDYNVDLVSGIASNPSLVSSTSVGNGWYRISTQVTVGAGGVSGLHIVYFKGTLNEEFYIWGAQLEAGAFPTSYIKTEASQVTRSADSASITGTNFSSWYRADEGTIYCEAKYSVTSQLSTVYIGDGTKANAIWVGKCVSGITSPREGQMYVRAFAANQGFPLGGSPITENFAKLCGAYKTNDFAFSSDGSAVTTDTVGLVPVVDRMLIGDYIYTTAKSQHIKKIAYYPKALTATELQALTS